MSGTDATQFSPSSVSQPTWNRLGLYATAFAWSVLILGSASYTWRTSGDALLALSAAARAREHRRVAREDMAVA